MSIKDVIFHHTVYQWITTTGHHSFKSYKRMNAMTTVYGIADSI